MATQVIIPARYCPFPRWWMLVYCLAGFLLALAGVLLSEPGHAGFLVLMLLILLRAPLQTLANRSETIIDSHARERGCILRKTWLLGTRRGPNQGTRELDISPLPLRPGHACSEHAGPPARPGTGRPRSATAATVTGNVLLLYPATAPQHGPHLPEHEPQGCADSADRRQGAAPLRKRPSPYIPEGDMTWQIMPT